VTGIGQIASISVSEMKNFHSITIFEPAGGQEIDFLTNTASSILVMKNITNIPARDVATHYYMIIPIRRVE
jgi:hypothetical protein